MTTQFCKYFIKCSYSVQRSFKYWLRSCINLIKYLWIVRFSIYMCTYLCAWGTLFKNLVSSFYSYCEWRFIVLCIEIALCCVLCTQDIDFETLCKRTIIFFHFIVCSYSHRVCLNWLHGKKLQKRGGSDSWIPCKKEKIMINKLVPGKNPW